MKTGSEKGQRGQKRIEVEGGKPCPARPLSS